MAAARQFIRHVGSTMETDERMGGPKRKEKEKKKKKEEGEGESDKVRELD
jgi:hypothetical protein